MRVTGRRAPAVLAMLALDHGRLLTVDRLAAVWGEDPPASVRNQVMIAVASLRRALQAAGADPQIIETIGSAYRLSGGTVDAQVFAELVGTARRAAGEGRKDEAGAAFGRALALWRGPMLDGVDMGAAGGVVGRWEELRLAAAEERAELELELGRHREAIGELRALLAEHPLRERLRGLLMLALYRSGRRADALEVYREGRLLLAEELGLDPGPELRGLEAAILADAPELRRVEAPLPGDEPERAAGRTAAPGGARGTADTGSHGTDSHGTGPHSGDSHGAGAQVREAEPSGPQGSRRTASPTARHARRPAQDLHVPAELPADMSGFVGRDDDLATLKRHLSPDAATTVVVVTIVGGAGIGKTALAVRFGHLVADEFPDGQLYVNLRGFSPGPAMTPREALTRLLGSLGVAEERVPDDEEAAAALYRSRLAGRRVFVLLDNALSAEQVRPLLPAAPGCVVVVTSRDRLVGLSASHGARRLALDVLPPSEALMLVEAVAGPEVVRPEPQAAAELVRLCGGLPLALRIAAATLSAYPSWGLPDYVKALGADRLDLLSIDGDLAVSTAFGLSYARLPEAARRLFRLLGLVPGADVGADAAAALAGTGLEETVELLDRLAAAHLVEEHRHRRYTFHDLLREHARRVARQEEPEEERRAALTRLLDHYGYLAERGHDLVNPNRRRFRPPLPRPSDDVPDHADRSAAVAWLTEEGSNVIAALRPAADMRADEHVWRIGLNLTPYLMIRGRYVDAAFVNEMAVTAARRAGVVEAESMAEFNLAVCGQATGRHEAALDHVRQALRLAASVGDEAGQAQCHGLAGLLHHSLGDYPDSIRCQRLALAAHAGTGNRLKQGLARMDLSRTLLVLGEHDQAEEELRAALALFREVGFQLGEGAALHVQGCVLAASGRHAEALAVLHESLRVLEEVGDPAMTATVRCAIGDVLRRERRFAEAYEELDRGLEAFAGLPAPGPTSEARNMLGALHRDAGRPEAALEAHGEALRLAEGIKLRLEQARAHHGLAEAYAALGRHDQAETHRRHAADLGARLGVRADGW
ncbi:AfsR/SARP family transcriptional regulator [Thermoactinospora rubra]|uniref:AfsR/SARP family transcriptional regulator n=1 Tax=Thermoactinospora rubra TaxID=1088767 RepID=UPI001301FAAF|nr:AfsR/SARP family transcriptional regulator [Thermoactinospora rubra]